MRIRTALLVTTALALPMSVSAQWTTQQFSVTPRGGFMTFDKSSGIEDAPYMGVDAAYVISPYLAIGTGLTVSRPQTAGDFFVSQMTFGDTTFYMAIEQPLMMIDVALNAQLRYPGERFSPFANAGIGYYTLDLDPQVSSRPERTGGISGSIGAGILYHLSPRVGIQLEVRDLIYTGFERDDLNPVSPNFNNTRYPEDFAPPPAAKETVHNIMFGIGFSFVPRAAQVADVPPEERR
jgi:hypothetical protein